MSRDILFTLLKKKTSMKSKFLLIIVAFISLVSVHNISYAQVINLGTAADFVLFSTNGAVTNVGITRLTGHVGTDVGGSTGFGNVDGVMHDQDPASAAATLDLNAAYLQLDAAVPAFFPGILLGAGQTLNAGVYSIPAAATMNGTLNLDAMGDPNAVFILQIEGTFGVGTGAQVVLLNSAQACNVYWKVEGQVSIAPSVTMRGTIVANNSAIAMSAGDTLEGRALSINGAIGVDAIVAFTPLGCLAPILTGPGNPVMGTTECFALFSGIGPVTNVGITTVNGDIGTNNGLTTGYNPLLVSGSIHPVPDGATAQCGVDFTNIYNNLNALPYDIELLYPAQFGNNLKLTPHVYLMNSAVTFTDSLYLNAQGNADAVFVFQVNGAFGTSTYSNIILENGAQAKNVYWVINGAISVSDYSIFNGTIISQGAIDLLTGVTLNGRALTGVGAISTSAINAIMPTSCSPFTITQPTDTVVCDGQSASFSIIAGGIGLTYQWRKGSVDLIDGGNISGATTATLTINPVTILDVATDYNVIVSGSFMPNDTSNYVSLSINSSPVITNQPADATVCAGDSTGFTVVSTGTGLTYQWRKGTVDLVNGGNISGATNDTLIINPAALGDASNDYNVVITGPCLADIISIDVILTVDSCLTDVSVLKTASSMTPVVGETIVFTIAASNLSAINATGVTVVDILQSGYSYVSSATSIGSFNSSTGVWTIGNLNAGNSATLTITAEVLNSGSYSNTATISATEIETDLTNNVSTIVTIPSDFFIPEGFSPNGDLVNDLFVIRGILNFPSNEFTVFNRWGNVVFSASPYQNTWDGKSTSDYNIGGDVLPVGTYFYVLDLKDGSDIYKGTIYLNN